jgi:hypothetical protein
VKRACRGKQFLGRSELKKTGDARPELLGDATPSAALARDPVVDGRRCGFDLARKAGHVQPGMLVVPLQPKSQ